MSQGFGTPPQTAQSGSGAILPWATGTVYAQGQTVTNSGHTYTANDAHTAGATFAGDLASHWTLLPLTAADVGAQPVDSDLTAIAALTTTSYGRAFLAQADAAAGRTALGLGTIATIALDTDGTLAANSDTRAPSQKAVKTYVDANAGGGTATPVRLSADRYRPGRILSSRFIPDTGKAATGVASTDIITVTSHGYSAGDVVFFSALNGGAGLVVGKPYVVLATNLAANTFSLGLTAGGAVVDFTTDISATSTVQRVSDAAQYTLSNFSYFTDPAGRPAIRATDGGTATIATLLTVANDIRNATQRVRYRPAKDATTSSTDYGVGLSARKLNSSNRWDVLQAHSAANPNTQLTCVCEGASTTTVTAAAPKSITAVGSTGIFTSAAHGYQDGDHVTLHNLVGGSGFTPQTVYYVTQANRAANTFSLAATDGGAVITGGTDISSGSVRGKVPTSTKDVTGVASTDIFTSSAHGFVAGDRVFFSGLTGGAGITAGTVYYVISANLATNTFQVSTTAGGSALNFTTNVSAGVVSYADGLSLDVDWIFEIEVIDDLYKMRSWRADLVKPDWQHVTRLRATDVTQDNSDIGSWGIGGGSLFNGAYINEWSVTEKIRVEGNLFRNPNFRVKDRPALAVLTPKDPAFWISGGSLLSGNVNDVVQAADDNGITRDALRLLITTPNDSNLAWTQSLYNADAPGVNAFFTRMRRYPTMDTPAPQMELSWLVQWSSIANVASLGFRWDLYYYDALGNVLNSGDPTYFPDARPSGAGASGGPTRMTARINLVNYERVFWVRAQLLPHDATMTGQIIVHDPELRFIA